MGTASSADPSRTRGKPAWLPLVASAVIVPTVLAGVTLIWPRTAIEEGLSRAAGESLSAAGLAGATVAFTGRDATISGLAGPDGERAVEIVEGVTGVRAAQLAGPDGPGPEDPGGAGGPDAGDPGTPAGPESSDAGAPEPPDVAATQFGISRRGEDVVLTGAVGSEEERAQLVAAATAQAAGRTVVDELILTEGAMLPTGVDAGTVGAAVAALAAATGTGLAATITADGLAITGSVADDAASDAVEQALAAALPGLDVDNQLTVDPDAAGGAGELDEQAKQDLQTAIDALLAAAPIGFQPNSPELTPAGAATVAAVVDLVVAAPGARLQVDGYVASGPGAGVLTAQELSDARAATVRDALVAGGVPAANIVARGLGEGDTPAAQAAGRRVEITVL